MTSWKLWRCCSVTTIYWFYVRTPNCFHCTFNIYVHNQFDKYHTMGFTINHSFFWHLTPPLFSRCLSVLEAAPVSSCGSCVFSQAWGSQALAAIPRPLPNPHSFSDGLLVKTIEHDRGCRRRDPRECPLIVWSVTHFFCFLISNVSYLFGDRVSPTCRQDALVLISACIYKPD